MMKAILFSVLLLLVPTAQPTREDVQASTAEHFPTVRVEQAAWAEGCAVVVTQPCGDAVVFAPDARTMQEAGYAGFPELPYMAQVGSASNAELCVVSWVSETPDGKKFNVEVRVPQKWGESEADWAERCADRVAAMQQKFPPAS